jgi:hypothetical protein
LFFASLPINHLNINPILYACHGIVITILVDGTVVVLDDDDAAVDVDVLCVEDVVVDEDCVEVDGAEVLCTDEVVVDVEDAVVGMEVETEVTVDVGFMLVEELVVELDVEDVVDFIVVEVLRLVVVTVELPMVLD